MTRIGNIFKLPDVTSYLVVGVIIGPSVLGRLGIQGLGFSSYEEVERLSIISDVALGFIAFSIGNEFKIKKLERIGKQAVIIAIMEATAASILVDIVLLIIHFSFPNIVTMPMVLTLGAIAAATAPAATLMVIKQYKAKGKVTEILLLIASIILTVAFAKITFKLGGFSGSFSPLLVCMMLGTVFCNICPLADDLMERADFWCKPILVLFFVLSGAELNLDVFKNPIVVMVGLVYVFSRSFGKYIGARFHRL